MSQKFKESRAGSSITTGDISKLDERIRWALEAAAEKKAIDLTVLDLRGIASFTDFFVIATGANKRQVQAISDEVVEQLKHLGTRSARVEGYQTAEWILIDYGDFVLHVFDEKARRFYDLERLWKSAKRLEAAELAASRGGRSRTASSPASSESVPARVRRKKA